ncbi:protein export chaperone secb [Paenibacillus sp. SC116]|uniref:protein export chaperone secb n=1 Tax=Paenibacillus sp. SC116 TaxID=2968986 RepID=UPI00215AACE0|nr:protein export chaperone secb [Paenibacillus sp. SC116]MCR8843329.1 protein export chaperone secb [Paenibacillus sp. SC116]
MKKQKMIKEYFYEDGSLRDIYIMHASQLDWESIFEYLDKNNIQYKITKDGELVNERAINQLMKLRQDYSLNISIDYKGISVSGYFYDADQIEFDIVPEQIQTEDAVDSLIEFMKDISKQINKEVILTEELDIENECFRVTPSGTINFL